MTLKINAMKKIFLIPLLFTVLACGSRKAEREAAYNEPIKPNMLTPGQAAEGWYLLFDGTSMNGWRIFKDQQNDSWEVIDGTLHCKPFKDNETNLRSDLISEEQYDNFELSFEWKISPQGNSGVMFRVTEEFDQPYASGPEYQLIDDKGYPGDLQPTQLTGANYDMHAPSEEKSNAVGEWNTSKLVVNDNHVEHWLNGTMVVEYDIQSDDWNQKVKNSKWKDFPGYGLAKKGHIDLQDHGNEVWLRSIMIKPL
jgi:hypothetical protein